MKKLEPCLLCGADVDSYSATWIDKKAVSLKIDCPKCGAMFEILSYADERDPDAFEKWNSVKRRDVLRCAACKYYDEMTYYCSYHKETLMAGNFCSFGEKR